MRVNATELADLISDDMQIFYEWINSELDEEIANEFDGSVSFFNTGLNLACTVRDNLVHYTEYSNYSKVYELNAFFRDFDDEKCPEVMDKFNIKFYLNVVAGQSVKTLNPNYTNCTEDKLISCHCWAEDTEGNYIVGWLNH